MIILFCGIPGSGKTTVAEILAERLARSGKVRLLSSDKLRAPVYRKFFESLAPGQERPDFLIFDATFYKGEWRRQVESLVRGEKVITVYLHCPLAAALKRNRERRPNISERVVHIVSHKMEPPASPTLAIDTTTTTAHDAAAKIVALIEARR